MNQWRLVNTFHYMKMALITRVDFKQLCLSYPHLESNLVASGYKLRSKTTHSAETSISKPVNKERAFTHTYKKKVFRDQRCIMEKNTKVVYMPHSGSVISKFRYLPWISLANRRTIDTSNIKNI